MDKFSPSHRRAISSRQIVKTIGSMPFAWRSLAVWLPNVASTACHKNSWRRHHAISASSELLRRRRRRSKISSFPNQRPAGTVGCHPSSRFASDISARWRDRPWARLLNVFEREPVSDMTCSASWADGELDGIAEVNRAAETRPVAISLRTPSIRSLTKNQTDRRLPNHRH